MKHNNLYRSSVIAISSALLFIGAIAPVFNNVVLTDTSQHETTFTLNPETQLVDGGGSGGAGTCASNNC